MVCKTPSPRGWLIVRVSRKSCESEQVSLGGEKTKEGIEERRFTCGVFEPKPCPLREHRVKPWGDSNIEEFQAMKSLYHAQHFRNVKFLVRAQPIEGER